MAEKIPEVKRPYLFGWIAETVENLDRYLTDDSEETEVKEETSEESL
jgi:hypothetical protein|tara:strand:- start:908 stop:1048 length:141 start_codon:yes stop_codon:yes gene_type:complete